jgi:hypothetical protein
MQNGGEGANSDLLEILAKRLHFKMEMLDPTLDDKWDELSDLKKEFYRQCCKEII